MSAVKGKNFWVTKGDLRARASGQLSKVTTGALKTPRQHGGVSWIAGGEGR
jgi:hypothetical protein